MSDDEVPTVAPVARWLTILTGIVCVIVPLQARLLTATVLSLTILVLLGLTVATVCGARPAFVRDQILVRLIAIVSAMGVFITVVIAHQQGAPLFIVAPLGSAVLVLGLRTILGPTPPSNLMLALLAGAYLLLVATSILNSSRGTDVELFVKGALAALDNGSSPYAITIRNPFSAKEAEIFYGPGVVQDGEVTYGYPYMPATLLLDYTTHWFADAVWMHFAAMFVAIALAWRMSTDRLGRAAVVLLALNPSTPSLIMYYWVESVMILFLAFTVWGLFRGNTWAVVCGLGLFFSSKQYAVFFLPAVWPVARKAGIPAFLLAAGLGAVVVGVFIIQDPQAFYRSVVKFQLVQPFRDDSISLLPGLRKAFGTFPPWVLAVTPMVGLVVSALIAWRTRPGPTSFALCVGLGLLATVLFSKQAFINYYMLVGSALLMAGITWPADSPARTSEPMSDDQTNATAPELTYGPRR